QLYAHDQPALTAQWESFWQALTQRIEAVHTQCYLEQQHAAYHLDPGPIDMAALKGNRFVHEARKRVAGGHIHRGAFPTDERDGRELLLALNQLVEAIFIHLPVTMAYVLPPRPRSVMHHMARFFWFV